MLPPTFMVTGTVIQLSVLPKLKRVSGVRACRFCLHPHTVCGCGQVPSWSHTSTRQAPATVTTAHSHNTTSVSTLIACPPPGMLPQGAAAPTGTYSEALTFNQAPQTHMRGVSCLPLPKVGYPSVDPCKTAPTPRREAPIRQKCPVVSRTKDSLPTASTSSCPLHPLNWDWKRHHLRDDVEKIRGAGAPGCHCRPWTRALHQESRSHSKEI